MRRKSYSPLVLVGVLLATLLISTPVFSDDGEGTSGILAAGNESFEQEVIRLVNEERISRGITPLAYSGSLTAAARAHNEDMISNDFFSHTGSDGSSPAQRACANGFLPYPWGACYVGENIAAGYLTPTDVMTAWMNSTGHRDNILNPAYREIGVGHNIGGAYGSYWTMELGSEPNVLPVFINDGDPSTDSVDVIVTLTEENVSSWGSMGDIVSVRLSEDPSFAGSQWRSFAETVPFTLSAVNTLKTVYVEFSDGVKQVVSQDSITLLPPTLVVAPSAITFLVEMGSTTRSPDLSQVLIDCEGRPTLEWTASKDQSWLILGDTAGMTPANLTVTLDESSGFFDSVGIVSGTVTVEATEEGTNDSPQNIPVTVHVVEEIYHTYLPSLQR